MNLQASVSNTGASRDERDPMTEHHRPNTLPDGHDRDDFDFDYKDGVAGPIRFPAVDGPKVWCKRHGWEGELPDVVRCSSVHPVHGQCWDIQGHYVEGEPESRHYVSEADEYGDEWDTYWTDADLLPREAEYKCWCGRTYGSQEALDEHLAFWADDDDTEEPTRTLTAVERRAESDYIAPVGVERYGEEGWTDPNDPLTEADWVVGALNANAAEAGEL